LARVSPVLTRPRPQDARTRFGRDIALLVAGALVALAVIIGVSAAVEGPAYVDRISIRNATPYAIDVEVTNGDRDGWTNLGPVSPDERDDFRAVVDKGDRWVVRVSSAGIDGGQIEVGREQLARRNWEITIGDEISGRLAENGATSAPQRP
jgi:hypothetical protein